jgi:putative membrane protein
MQKDFKSAVTIQALKNVSLYKALITIFLVSILALVFLFWLLYFKQGSDHTFDWVRHLPTVNASLNSISTVLLILGFLEIRKRNFDRHMRFMLAAFVGSTLFLVSYVVYHNFVGHTPFPGTGWIRPVYFVILISHIILSAGVVPLILSSFYFAFSGKFDLHRKISRITFPVWLYVSVTGVVIYFILNAYVK